MSIAPFKYWQGAPSGYVCSSCGAHGVKLWREHSVCLERVTLACFDCACAEQVASGRDVPTDLDGGGRMSNVDFPRSDQFWGRVPATPTEDGETFWGYTSVPDDGVKWWKRLASRADGWIFWSGVRACMLAEARQRYRRQARIVSVAIELNDLLPPEEWAFWSRVQDLQLLGEVGGEP